MAAVDDKYILVELRAIAKKIDEVSQLPNASGHSKWCDYLHRNPPLRADCECGEFARRESEREDQIDRILELLK